MVPVQSSRIFLKNGLIVELASCYMVENPRNFTQLTPQQRAEVVKNNAKRVREAATSLRETIKAMHEKGTLKEISSAIQEAATAARDTAKEIEAGGTIKETATVVKETAHTAEEAAKTTRKSTKGSEKPRTRSKKRQAAQDE